MATGSAFLSGPQGFLGHGACARVAELRERPGEERLHRRAEDEGQPRAPDHLEAALQRVGGRPRLPRDEERAAQGPVAEEGSGVAVHLLPELEGPARVGQGAIGGAHGLSRLALSRLARGDLVGAREAAERGLGFALAHGLGGAEAANRVAQARVLLAETGAKAIAAANEEIDRAEALARERGLHVTLALVEEARAEVAALAGDTAARERALREVARLHRACGDAWAAEQAEARISA